MAKISFNPIVDAMSGELNHFNITTHKKKFMRNGEKAQGLIRKKMKKNPILRNFNSIAFKILSSSWNQMSDTEKQSWKEASLIYTESKKNPMSPYNAFQKYYIQKYIETLGINTKPFLLTDSSPNNSYPYRELRLWRNEPSSSFTFGVKNYGRGTFGK